MTLPAPRRSLRLWLTAALLAIIALPPLAVWAAHAVTATTSGPDARTLTAARTFAIDNVNHWTDPAWQGTARAYFTTQQVDAELRPSHGPWFTTRSTEPAPGSVDPGDKFIVPGPDTSATPLGSGWVIPRVTSHTDWTLSLAGGALTLLLTVTATGIFLGRNVVRPLALMSRAAAELPRGNLEIRVPPVRVREVAEVASALQSAGAQLRETRVHQADMEDQRRLFLSAIAHDLRTPLFTLRAYLDGLNDGVAATPQKADRYLQVCRSSAQALDRLVTDLFTYARLDFLDQQPRHDPVDLGLLLHTAVLAQQPQADAKSIALNLTGPPGACTINGDAHLLNRVVDNLLDNALRHTPAGGAIDLHYAVSEHAATLTITDTGPGIAPEDLPHLFKPLYRADTSRNRATGGAGLGLAIAHRIVLAHGGTLTAGNASPSGACFTTRLPTSRPKPGTAPKNNN